MIPLGHSLEFSNGKREAIATPLREGRTSLFLHLNVVLVSNIDTTKPEVRLIF